MTHATATANMMHPPVPAEPGSGVYSNKLGMWVFLASDVMFFTALIGSYIILRFGVPEAWAAPGAVLNVPLTAFNTFLLICSSVSMVKAYAAIADGKKYFLRAVPGKLLRDGGLKFWMLVTIICGAMFVGVHVTCGVVSMLYLYFTKVLPEKYSAQDYRGIETIGLYWHFVDLVWIILFTIVYLI